MHASAERAVRGLVRQVLSDANEDRNAAVPAARNEAYAEAEPAAETRLADAVFARHARRCVEALTGMKASESVRQKVVA